MIVLAMGVTVEVKGCCGVAVGFGVFEGGIREIVVADGCTVMVGAKVGNSVEITKVGVQVDSSWMGVMVVVGNRNGVGG